MPSVRGGHHGAIMLEVYLRGYFNMPISPKWPMPHVPIYYLHCLDLSGCDRRCHPFHLLYRVYRLEASACPQETQNHPIPSCQFGDAEGTNICLIRKFVHTLVYSGSFDFRPNYFLDKYAMAPLDLRKRVLCAKHQQPATQRPGVILPHPIFIGCADGVADLSVACSWVNDLPTRESAAISLWHSIAEIFMALLLGNTKEGGGQGILIGR